MKNVYLSIFILLGGINYVNSQNFDTLYLDKDWNPTGSKNYTYYRLTKQDSNSIKFTDYYKNGEIQSSGAYKDSNFVDKTGPFYYYKNNRLTSFQLYEATNYPEVLASLDSIASRIPPQLNSLMLEIIYNKSNAIKSIGYYNDFCNKVGTWLYFWRNGEYVFVETYTNGVLDGPLAIYHLDKVYRTGYWKEGKKHGEWNFYNKNGQLYKRRRYQDGKKIKVVHYEANQNL